MTDPLSKYHPELRTLAKTSPRILVSNRNLWLINFLLRWMFRGQPQADVRMENLFSAEADGQPQVRLRVYRPRSVAAPTPALLWFHGGGFVLGKPEQDDAYCAQFVRELGLTVISVDYRLAPKHPFPAGLDDAYTALKWIVAHAQELAIDPQRIAVGGNSAGGGLAAALAQLAHDRQEVRPVCQLLIYPMLDDRTVLRTDLDDHSNVTWTQPSNRFGWESYTGQACGAEHAPAYAVPARRADLSGLPPAWVGVGSLDIFHDEDVAYAQRLQACGVACDLEISPGAFHGFDVFDAQVPIVQAVRRSQMAALKKYLFP